MGYGDEAGSAEDGLSEYDQGYAAAMDDLKRQQADEAAESSERVESVQEVMASPPSGGGMSWGDYEALQRSNPDWAAQALVNGEVDFGSSERGRAVWATLAANRAESSRLGGLSVGDLPAPGEQNAAVIEAMRAARGESGGGVPSWEEWQAARAGGDAA